MLVLALSDVDPAQLDRGLEGMQRIDFRSPEVARQRLRERLAEVYTSDGPPI